VPGETHLYLGRQYRLRVHCAGRASVKLVGRFFEVHLHTPKEPQAVAAVMHRWYQSHAERVFRDRLAVCLQAGSALPHVDVRLRVRAMVRRWGSCSKDGLITLNADLIKMPIHCIDYVIMHELCHLCVHDHSPAFFKLLGRCMPNWKQRKQRLDSLPLP
jgi:predicted metal-dependent hydrolase